LRVNDECRGIRTFRLRCPVFLFLALFLPASVRAEGVTSHSGVVGLAIGLRGFDDSSSLGDDFSFGGRAGLNLGSRLSVLADFLASHPSRNSATPAVYVDALRMLVRYNIREGSLRPYVLAGAGGLFFLYHDTPTRSMRAWTGGLGVDYRIAPETRAFFELSRDLYSEQDVSYDSDGTPAFAGEEQTRSMSAVSIGFSVDL